MRPSASTGNLTQENNLTRRTLEPCDDILTAMSVSSTSSAFVRPAPVLSVIGDDSQDSWWQVNDWDGNLHGEVAVMRVDNVHLILDGSIPLELAP